MKKLLPFLFILCLPFSADAKVDGNNTNYDEYRNTESLLADTSSCRAMENKEVKETKTSPDEDAYSDKEYKKLSLGEMLKIGIEIGERESREKERVDQEREKADRCLKQIEKLKRMGWPPSHKR